MTDDEITQNFKELVNEGAKIKSELWTASAYSDGAESHNKKFYRESVRWKSKCLNILGLRFGKGSDFYNDFFNEIRIHHKGGSDYCEENVGKALGILESALYALETNLTEDLFYKKEMIILSDLLEQAEEFLSKGLDLAAGIYGRIVLETVIREFAEKNEIRNEKFDQLIIQLRKLELISKPLENSLRANYEIGSWAAHGDEKFMSLTKNQKKEFLEFIRDKVLTLS